MAQPLGTDSDRNCLGSMRRRESWCAMHQLRSFLHRMQDPNAKAKEDIGQEGL